MDVMIFTPIRLFGEALCAELEVFPEIGNVITCLKSNRLSEKVIKEKIDMVLFDITHDEVLFEARAITNTCPNIPIIAMAISEVAKDVIACADAGFIAYMPRNGSIDELRGLMNMALRGEADCHPKVVAGLLKELCRRQNIAERHTGESLTRREIEVLQLVGEGQCNKEIARSLNLSVSTVKSHLHNVFSKLHVRGRSEAIVRLRSEPWLQKAEL